ncbi:aspartate/glutamate racemase family protein [Nonomuraea sp. MG754425]|uniref:aspartate/glutamate racemase family protein n=1 Tax=Nonomuraea sp. MG754425 TaxID=2570319 RepID=UPI001F2BBE87|nr:aspartate/glutamate racemase family protein [Nonomuraea sp. MG754425]MCF6475936.1 aspartate/glutamate racemase family protein [Nonomuraea sp. MG754425]
MTKTLGLIHTSATLVPVFAELCARHLPDVETFNIVDDSLIKNTIAAGRLTPGTARRVAGHVASAEAAGADHVLVTCSSIGAAVEASEPLTGVPVTRVDRPMADRAVATGRRVGVLATLSTTLDPTADLVRRRAAAAGAEITLTARLCEGAFEALMSGDAAAHDAAVAGALRELGGQVDVIVLAQASMARVAGTAEVPVPVLASPPIAMEHLAKELYA